MKIETGLTLCAAFVLLTWGCGRSPEQPVEPVRRIEPREEPREERVITAEDLPGADAPYKMPPEEIDDINGIEEDRAEISDPPADVPAPPEEPAPEEVIEEPEPDKDPVAMLKELGIDFNRWAFIEAAGEGNLEAVELFLEAGADPDVINAPRYGETALMWAARGGHAGVARALIEGGADVNIRNARDMTALGYALMFGRTETAGVIRAAGGVR